MKSAVTRPTLLLTALLFAGSLVTAWGVAQPEWPRFRGPNGAGIGATLSLPDKLSQDAIRWKIALPAAGHSSPVIAGDRLFLTSGDKESGGQSLLCIAVKDGKILWEEDFTSATYRQHADNSLASATPTVDAERVYLCSFSPQGSWLAAFNQKDGKQTWKVELGNYVSQHGPGSSPIVWENLVIIDFDQDEPKSFIAAFDAATGKEQWRWEKPGDKHTSSTPCIYIPKSGAPELIAISNTVGMSGLDARTGKVVWQLPGLMSKRCVASPFITPGGLVIGQCGEGQAESFVSAVKVSDDGKSAQRVYEVVRSGGYVPTPVAVGDYLFLWKENGLVTCVKADTNEQVWSERVQGPFYGSPIAIAGKLYNMTRRGELVVVNAGDTFKEIGRFDLGEGSHATPAVAGGRLFLRTFTHLIAIGK